MFGVLIVINIDQSVLYLNYLSPSAEAEVENFLGAAIVWQPGLSLFHWCCMHISQY